ncbi:MAG: nitroreductase family protein [Firmicutes bacterium]|nr:nitroreductase family protein [Bacillota bacterium]
MNVKDAIMKRRTIRKFTRESIPESNLIELVNCARVAAYGANMQPLKFRIVTDKAELDAIFPHTSWAGYLENGAPSENERPTAYIAVLGDSAIRPNGGFEVEAGAAVTTMMLEAVEMGLASCWLGAINRDEIKNVLNLDDKLSVVYMLALGYGAQESRMVDIADNNVKYYLDGDNVLNVPKRTIDEVLIK